MSCGLTYAEGPLNRLAADLGKHLRRPVRVQWITDSHGDPCAWLEALENQDAAPHDCDRIGSLTIRQRGPTSTYSVTPIEGGATGKYAALPTALRALRAATLKSLKKAPSPALSAASAMGREPSRPAAGASTFTAAEAIRHPAIRAAIFAGQRVASATGHCPDPVILIALVNAALPVVALIEDAYRPQHVEEDPEGTAWTERVLVDMLEGALKAAAQRSLGGASSST
jgi:hypothetical protein